MKVIYDDALFDTIPGLCVGILAIRAVDNRGVNLEAEAFRRRCCTEANLLLKMNPAMADGEIKRYDDALAHLHMKGTTAISSLFKEYKKELGIEEEEEAKAGDDYEILSQPKAASLDELAGSDVLPRMNPVMDMVRGGMLKFHVFRVDAVHFHAAGVKFQCEGADEVVPFIDDLTPVAYDDAQGAGVGGAPVGGFKVDGRVFHRFSFRWKR
jgi:hypothetical protein